VALITEAADPWLDTLTTEKLQEHVIREEAEPQHLGLAAGSAVIYHYWYHTGENLAIRQTLGTRATEFVATSTRRRPTGRSKPRPVTPARGNGSSPPCGR